SRSSRNRRFSTHRVYWLSYGRRRSRGVRFATHNYRRAVRSTGLCPGVGKARHRAAKNARTTIHHPVFLYCGLLTQVPGIYGTDYKPGRAAQGHLHETIGVYNNPTGIDTPYDNLLAEVLAIGTLTGDRTGTGTYSVFGRQMRFNLAEYFPLITTKRVHFKSAALELIWFLNGDSNVQ